MPNDDQNDINSAPIAETKLGNIKAITMGCRLNTYETEAMKLAARSINQEIILVNTCAVTASCSPSQASNKKAKRENPDAKIIVSGCAAQIDPQSPFAQMDEVEKVIGNSEKTKPETYQGLLLNDERMLVDDILSVKETAGHLIDGVEGRTRAYIQVQNLVVNRRPPRSSTPLAANSARPRLEAALPLPRRLSRRFRSRRRLSRPSRASSRRPRPSRRGGAGLNPGRGRCSSSRHDSPSNRGASSAS